MPTKIVTQQAKKSRGMGASVRCRKATYRRNSGRHHRPSLPFHRFVECVYLKNNDTLTEMSGGECTTISAQSSALSEDAEISTSNTVRQQKQRRHNANDRRSKWIGLHSCTTLWLTFAVVMFSQSSPLTTSSGRFLIIPWSSVACQITPHRAYNPFHAHDRNEAYAPNSNWHRRIMPGRFPQFPPHPPIPFESSQVSPLSTLPRPFMRYHRHHHQPNERWTFNHRSSSPLIESQEENLSNYRPQFATFSTHPFYRKTTPTHFSEENSDGSDPHRWDRKEIETQSETGNNDGSTRNSESQMEFSPLGKQSMNFRSKQSGMALLPNTVDDAENEVISNVENNEPQERKTKSPRRISRRRLEPIEYETDDVNEKSISDVPQLEKETQTQLEMEHNNAEANNEVNEFEKKNDEEVTNSASSEPPALIPTRIGELYNHNDKQSETKNSENSAEIVHDTEVKSSSESNSKSIQPELRADVVLENKLNTNSQMPNHGENEKAILTEDDEKNSKKLVEKGYSNRDRGFGFVKAWAWDRAENYNVKEADNNSNHNNAVDGAQKALKNTKMLTTDDFMDKLLKPTSRL